MAVKKFKVTITRTDEYEFDVDDDIINEEWMKDYSRYFSDVDGDVEELLKNLAFLVMRNGDGEFYEGFGNIKTRYSKGDEKQYYNTKAEFTPGIEMKLISMDDDFDYEVEEIKPKAATA